MSEIAKSLDEAGRHRSAANRTAKLAVLAVLLLASIVACWWFIHQALYGHQPLLYWAWVAISAMLWMVFSSYFAIINPHRWVFFGLNVLSLAAYIFIMPKDIYVIAGGLMFFLLSVWFQQRIAHEEKNQLNFSMTRTVSASVLLATYGFLFVIGFNVYNYSSQDFRQNPEKYYSKLTDAAAKGLPLVSQTFSGSNLNQSLDDYLFQRAQSNLPEDLKDSTPLQKNEYVRQYREQFIRQFGLTSTENQTVASAITQIIDQRSEELFNKYSRIFPIVFALAIFGLLRTFAFVFNWITIFFSWLLFKILLKLRFFRIGTATVEVDRLEI